MLRTDSAPHRFAAVLAAAALALGSTSGAACGRDGFVVAIDPGHTAAAPGAISARGVPEVRFNDKLAGRIVDALQDAGFTRAFLTRRGDAPITLADRARIANARSAQLFISIHHDSAQPHKLQSRTYRGQPRLYTDEIRGFSVFVSQRNAEPAQSERFARLLATQLIAACLQPTLHHAEAIAGENRKLLDQALGLYAFDELAVLRLTQMPAVLFEAGVIVHRDEELLLRSRAHRSRLAALVTAAVIDFCEGRPAPPPIARAASCR